MSLSRRLDLHPHVLHPHVHMVMPAAALDAKRALWRTKSRRARASKADANTPSGGYLFNHKALAKVFRAKVLDALAHAGLALPTQLPT